MNSYERRIVHVELAIHPEVTTESMGVGKERYVIVKPIEEKAEVK
jgi:predicted RNA-binding protein Jag